VIRRVCAWAAASAAVLSMWAAVPATADEASPSPAVPETEQTPDAPESTPSTPPEDGGIEQGEVTRPNPEAPSPRNARVLVFGDSISASHRYTPYGTAKRPQAWWAHVAQAASVPPREVMLSAESGSGLLMRGMSKGGGTICTGTTFRERLGDIATTRPDVIMVEVGRNDVRACQGGRPRRATAAERRAAAVRFFDALAAAADRQGVRRSNVYVLTAWGSAQSNFQVDVTTLYEAQVRARGFSWVPVPALVKSQTVDGTHPTAAGAKVLGTSVAHGSDVVTAIRSGGTRHAAPAARTSVLCTGVKTCRATGLKISTPSSRRIWGLAPRTPAHHVAQTLTAKRKVAPVLGANTPREWRIAARTEKAATAVAHARVGDVAWWRTAPASVGRSTGHVAVVQRVAANNSWVVVTEMTARGTYRSVRYAGADLPRAYLRFSTAKGNVRGLVSRVTARRGSVVVTGRAVDTDALQRGVRLRVTVTQHGRTWTRTTPRAVGTRFTQRFATSGLRAGRATVRVVALNVPGTRGGNRTLATRRVTVR